MCVCVSAASSQQPAASNQQPAASPLDPPAPAAPAARACVRSAAPGQNRFARLARAAMPSTEQWEGCRGLAWHAAASHGEQVGDGEQLIAPAGPGSPRQSPAVPDSMSARHRSQQPDMDPPIEARQRPDRARQSRQTRQPGLRLKALIYLLAVDTRPGP